MLRARGLAVCQRRGIGSPARRLKARSSESLRSVSPGSDSVFYSESADLAIGDHHVQCHNCGKQVDIVTASAEAPDTPATGAGAGAGAGGDELMVVKPPAGFGDSPDGPRSPSRAAVAAAAATRLYKKMDKRFRSEERHAGERRMYRHRQESARAKVGGCRRLA